MLFDGRNGFTSLSSSRRRWDGYCELRHCLSLMQDNRRMELEHRRLGTSDLTVSSIGLGCVTFGREIDQATSFAILDRAVDRGINLLDTAAVYGSGASEEILGLWMQSRGARNRVVLATKVSGRLTRARILKSVDESLGRLSTDRIDLFQVHSWDSKTPLEETLDAIDQVIRAGKVRVGGCSNWEAPHLQEAVSLAEQHDWNRL
jgi:aryl-alcohol dehydrogenase-like predicted oxidoreductase